MTQADILAVKDKSDVQKYFLGSVLSGGSSDPAAPVVGYIDWLAADGTLDREHRHARRTDRTGA